MAWTNRGKARILDAYFRAQNQPSTFSVALVTSAVAPSVDTNTLSQLTEISTGNGYSAGGISLTRNTSDFDALTEDDSGDLALVQIKDLVWTASGGSIPSAGDGARYAILHDGTDALAYWDLSSDRSVSDGQTLTLENCELRLTEPA